MQTLGKAYYQEGKITSVFGFIQDITEYKKAEDDLIINQKLLIENEAKYKSLAENSRDYIIRYDRSFRHLYQNQAAYDVSGFSEAEFVRKTHRELGFDEALCELWERKIAFVFETKNSTGEIFEWESVDGPVFLDWRLYPEFDSNGEVKTVLGVSRDITKQRKLEERLHQSNKMEAIGTLASGIAHDFNNLLAPIVGYAELTQLKLEPEIREYQYQQNIIDSADRAKSLIEKIFIISKPFLGQQQPVKADVIANEIVVSLREVLPPQSEIIVDFAENIPAISSDPSQINQLIFNLSLNAVQAIRENSSDGKVLVKINVANAKNTRFENQTNCKEYLVVSVQDNGPGMSSETTKAMFDPFFTTKVKNGERGTGLGLAIVSSVVKQHVGEIEVESELGKGTRITVYLPIVKNESNNNDEPNSSSTDSCEGSQRILLIDDEEAVNDMLTSILNELGYQVDSYTVANEAFRRFEREPEHFNLIITDYLMPKLTGPQLIKKIKEAHSSAKVLMITGYSNLATEENIAKWNCDDIIAKPFNVKALNQTIRKVINTV